MSMIQWLGSQADLYTSSVEVLLSVKHKSSKSFHTRAANARHTPEASPSSGDLGSQFAVVGQ